METQNIIPTQIIKNELGPKYCPKVSNYIVQQTIPLSIEYDCGHCEYYNGLKNNCVLCAKKNKMVFPKKSNYIISEVSIFHKGKL